MSTGAAAMVLQGVFDGNLSMSDMDMERRPYHKNCSCALHKQKGEQKSTCVFPKRQKGQDMTSSIEAYNYVSPSSSSRDN
ncbi:unnamed protein product [Withania somnifera]